MIAAPIEPPKVEELLTDIIEELPATEQKEEKTAAVSDASVPV